MGNDPRPLFAAVFIIIALGFVLRWVFRPSRSHRAVVPPDAADSKSLGLLTVVLSGVGRQRALERRSVLQEAGLRSSMSRRHDGTFDVLVFHADADRARTLLER